MHSCVLKETRESNHQPRKSSKSQKKKKDIHRQIHLEKPGLNQNNAQSHDYVSVVFCAKTVYGFWQFYIKCNCTGTKLFLSFILGSKKKK